MTARWAGLGTVERFVQAVVGGGVMLVAGLWLVERFAPGSLPWLGGVLLALGGIAGLAWGIATELSV